ncbi:hypothetical protein [Acinetobacter defluvii]|uniref:hypothetical protein n=1 Tax=Acinetobacter defluvii TaxID=1871111 RepID=UPI0008264284|nr:hypothetical protein [Acinetobacter defluvii]
MQENINQSLESQARTLTDKEKIKIEKYLTESNTLILNKLNWKALKKALFKFMQNHLIKKRSTD